MIPFKSYIGDAGEHLDYHLKHRIGLNENLFRVGSKAYYELFQEARKRYSEGTYEPDGLDKILLDETDIGYYAKYKGQPVPLDCPMVEATGTYNGSEVELNEPKRGGSKKYYVYVKNEKGNVIKIQWGDTTGLTAKINDEKAAKSFAARHQCDQKTDKTTAGYWACRLPRYAKQLGLSGGGNYWW